MNKLALPCRTGGASEEKPVKKWRIGDFCRAVYSEDGELYEAEILSIGGARCRLRYVGYGNEEDQPLARLQPSAGRKERRRQEKQAESERQGEEGEECDGEEQEEAEEGEEEPDEEESVGRAAEKSARKVHKSAPRRAEPSAQNSGGYPGDGQNYHGHSQQTGYSEVHPAPSYPGWGPWTAGPGPRGPPGGPWGPHAGPWGGAPPFPGPWSAQQSSRGPYSAQGPMDSFAHTPPLPPPPPPPPLAGDADPVQLANMLMSWYISGYHTGFYQASREAASRTGRK